MLPGARYTRLILLILALVVILGLVLSTFTSPAVY